jgi:hypothetical protein
VGGKPARCDGHMSPAAWQQGRYSGSMPCMYCAGAPLTGSPGAPTAAAGLGAPAELGAPPAAALPAVPAGRAGAGASFDGFLASPPPFPLIVRCKRTTRRRSLRRKRKVGREAVTTRARNASQVRVMALPRHAHGSGSAAVTLNLVLCDWSDSAVPYHSHLRQERLGAPEVQSDAAVHWSTHCECVPTDRGSA